MTISNTNLQSILLAPTENSAGGPALAAIMSPGALPSDTAKGDQGEGDFWAMLSQQFSEITSMNDAEVIENKDLLAMISAFEDELEATSGTIGIPAEWMQFLKSHFQVIADGEEPGGELDSSSNLAGVMSHGLLAANSSAAIDGEALPPGRQTVTPVMPQPDLPSPLITASQGERPVAVRQSISSLEISDETSMPNVAEEFTEFMTLKDKSNLTPTPADKNVDFALQRQIIGEQSAGAGRGFENQVFNSHAPITPASTVSSAASAVTLALPGGLHSLQMAPSANPAQWGEAVGERVSFMINHKLSQAEIRIDPPHLGKLDIQIQVKDDTAVVVIQTQHAQTRDLIDSAGHRLREFLQEAGYSSVDVNVSHQQQSDAQRDFDQNGEGRSSSTESGWKSDDPSSSADGGQLAQAYLTDPGRIDYFA